MEILKSWEDKMGEIIIKVPIPEDINKTINLEEGFENLEELNKLIKDIQRKRLLLKIMELRKKLSKKSFEELENELYEWRANR
jgi:hypothetical protein